MAPFPAGVKRARTSIGAAERARPRRRGIPRGARLIDRELAAVDLHAVQLFRRELALLFTAESDEGKTAGPACEAIAGDMHFGDGAELFERIAKIRFRGVERQVPDVEL